MTDIVERLWRYFDRREGGEYHCAIVDASAEITSLRLSLKEIREENDRLKGERDANEVASKAFNEAIIRAERAEASCDSMAKALEQIIDMNIQYAIDRWGDANQAEPMSCVVTARRALAAYRKEKSE